MVSWSERPNICSYESGPIFLEKQSIDRFLRSLSCLWGLGPIQPYFSITIFSVTFLKIYFWFYTFISKTIHFLDTSVYKIARVQFPVGRLTAFVLLSLLGFRGIDTGFLRNRASKVPFSCRLLNWLWEKPFFNVGVEVELLPKTCLTWVRCQLYWFWYPINSNDANPGWLTAINNHFNSYTCSSGCT